MEQYHNRRQIRHYFLCDVNSVFNIRFDYIWSVKRYEPDGSGYEIEK